MDELDPSIHKVTVKKTSDIIIIKYIDYINTVMIERTRE